jgi:putative transposase
MMYAFQKALWRRRPGNGLLVHSDRGVQYASTEFRELLKENRCIQSMSRKGNCWDNAVAESFFHTLKTQLIYHVRFKDKDEAEQALFNYIEVYYNRRRRHSTIGYKSPAMFEMDWMKQEKVA